MKKTRGAGTAEASRTTYAYDKVGNLLATKSGRATGVPYDVQYTYDELNRQVRAEDSNALVTYQAHDEAGNLLCTRLPKGGTGFPHGAAPTPLATLQAAVCAGPFLTRHEYDEESKLVRTTDALGGQYSFVYDKARNLVAKQDARLGLTTYEYDALNRRTVERAHLDAHARLTWADRDSSWLAEARDTGLTTGTLDTVTTYDASGNVATVKDAEEQLCTHTYDLLNRLRRQDYSGHVAPRQLPSLNALAYSYTDTGELLTVDETKLTATGVEVQQTVHGYDSLARRVQTLRLTGAARLDRLRGTT